MSERPCATLGCDRSAVAYWHDAGPFGAGTFYGCAEHAPADSTPIAKGLRVLMCGDRNWDDPLPIILLVRGLKHGPRAATIIEGAARGADLLAGLSAERQAVDHEKYPAKWDEHGRAAGPIRNQQMLTEGKPDVVFAFHDDLANSKGTQDMCKRAAKAGIPVYVVSRYDGHKATEGAS